MSFMFGAASLAAEEAKEPVGLVVRRVVEGRKEEGGKPVPRAAVRVFTCEGDPHSVRVTEKYIAVEYIRSGVLFDRKTGRVARRFTVADGWPKEKPDDFGPSEPRRARRSLVGPGVAYGYHDKEQIAASIEFDGKTWRAIQPPRFLGNLLKGSGWKERREKYGSWTPILQRLNRSSYLEASADEGKPARRFTMREGGLASNIVTHLAVADGKLWAACVDIYDPQIKKWGPGGLCRYDPKEGRWQRIEKIDGRPVRWVTLLETHGDELWVGFREGSGVEGDRVVYGMGLYPGDYRPKATSIVLARLTGGKWTSFVREPLRDAPPRFAAPSEKDKLPAPTEKPWTLARSGDKVVLFSLTGSPRISGNWSVPLDGHASLLDLKTGKWRLFDLYKDFDADRIKAMTAESGEVIVATNRGAHRWDAKTESWGLLDPGCVLRNPELSAAVPVGKELWVGYTNQSFGVVGEQGISRYDERTGKWDYITPDQIGTACPVRRIAPTPKGDVWVLFQPRPWGGSAMEFPYHLRETKRPSKPGLGRFSGGKWEFPVKLEGEPDESRDLLNFMSPSDQLAVVGDKVFVAIYSGVYMGPGEWKSILSGPAHDIWASSDGETLLITRYYPHESRPGVKQRFQQGQYNPQTGKVSFRDIDMTSEEYHTLRRRHGHLLEWRRSGSLGSEWVRIEPTKGKAWAFGPLGGGVHAVVETPEASWIASRGELIRLDRKKLTEYLGE